MANRQYPPHAPGIAEGYMCFPIGQFTIWWYLPNMFHFFWGRRPLKQIHIFKVDHAADAMWYLCIYLILSLSIYVYTFTGEQTNSTFYTTSPFWRNTTRILDISGACPAILRPDAAQRHAGSLKKGMARDIFHIFHIMLPEISRTQDGFWMDLLMDFVWLVASEAGECQLQGIGLRWDFVSLAEFAQVFGSLNDV